MLAFVVVHNFPAGADKKMLMGGVNMAITGKIDPHLDEGEIEYSFSPSHCPGARTIIEIKLDPGAFNQKEIERISEFFYAMSHLHGLPERPKMIFTQMVYRSFTYVRK